MRHCTVATVMTTDVVTVPTGEPFKNLASLFVEWQSEHDQSLAFITRLQEILAKHPR
jgi:hypothetical protein